MAVRSAAVVAKVGSWLVCVFHLHISHQIWQKILSAEVNSDTAITNENRVGSLGGVF